MESLETRYYISSLQPDPKAILAAVRAHWGIEDNLHWTMDVTFDEGRCRTQKRRLLAELRRHPAFRLQYP
jgi:predicted transposase YbfD/YdcC